MLSNQCQTVDEYLIVACDGIYDVMSNDELCSFVHARLEVTKDGALSKVCNEVRNAEHDLSSFVLHHPYQLSISCCYYYTLK